MIIKAKVVLDYRYLDELGKPKGLSMKIKFKEAGKVCKTKLYHYVIKPSQYDTYEEYIKALEFVSQNPKELKRVAKEYIQEYIEDKNEKNTIENRVENAVNNIERKFEVEMEF